MLCPVCKEPLARTKRHDVDIDVCRSCRGVWLDRGELEKIIAYSIDHEIYPEPAEYANPPAQKMDRFQVYPPPDERKRLFFEQFLEID